jgi:formate hydrogenlyase subunit 3/multisubunit Na+/H+ antiporter MnhD subunit
MTAELPIEAPGIVETQLVAAGGPEWAVIAIAAPLVGALAAVAAPRIAAASGLAATAFAAGAVVLLALQVHAGGPVAVALGGWGAPLGIDLRADGLSVLMLALTALVGSLVCLAALSGQGRRPDPSFWGLWLLLLAGLNGVFLSGDIFNLYVMLEVISLAAVGLTVVGGGRAAMRAGLEYMLASLLGALLFLLGVAWLYLQYGRLDIAGLASVVAGTPADTVAFALILAGLALKTALFPLHFWLPAAHAGAAAPASALLSGLVIKGSLYILLRLWIEVFEPSRTLGLLLGALGATAMLWGSVQALRAERLKLLVAWSTVAQIGLIFLAFALAGGEGAALAWQGAVLLLVAHGLAKAAMFLAVGRIVAEVGHDVIARLDRSPVRPTLAQFTFALAAVSLIGLPPSAGFAGKWLLMEGAMRAGDWVWVVVVIAGTGLSTAYLARVLVAFLRFDRLRGPVGEHQGWALADAPPLVLAAAAAGLGLAAIHLAGLATVGAPQGMIPATPAVMPAGVLP